MGVGGIFVATTLAPIVVLLASVSLNLLTIGLDQLSKCKRPLSLFMCSALGGIVRTVWHSY